MTVEELGNLVTSLELADELTEVTTLLEQVIDAAESLLATAEADGQAKTVGDIARELRRAFEFAAERSDPATRTRLLVGASFWSLRATSADVERVASTDYRSMVMLPASSAQADAAQLDFAAPIKTPPVATATPNAGSDASAIAAPAGLTPSVDAAAGDTHTTTNTLTPVSFTDPDARPTERDDHGRDRR